MRSAIAPTASRWDCAMGLPTKSARGGKPALRHTPIADASTVVQSAWQRGAGTPAALARFTAGLRTGALTRPTPVTRIGRRAFAHCSLDSSRRGAVHRSPAWFPWRSRPAGAGLCHVRRQQRFEWPPSERAAAGLAVAKRAGAVLLETRGVPVRRGCGRVSVLASTAATGRPGPTVFTSTRGGCRGFAAPRSCAQSAGSSARSRSCRCAWLRTARRRRRSGVRRVPRPDPHGGRRSLCWS